MALTLEGARQLLFREARLMDEGRFDEWLDLWAAKATYWVPCNDAAADPAHHIALVYLDRVGIAGRLMRLKSGLAYAQEPRSRMCRVVANVECEASQTDADRATLRSVFNLTELRRGEQHTFAGRSQHDVVLEGGEWRIERKKVELLNLDEPIANLTFLV